MSQETEQKGFYSFEDLKNGLANVDAGKIGIEVNPNIAMDEAPAMITTVNAGTPNQYLQFMDPDVIRTVVAPLTIDELAGRRIAGDWADEEIVTKVIERIGQAKLYGDKQNVPLASTNVNFEKRKVVRLELGFEISHLEERRAAKMGISNEAEKREGVAQALQIAVNDIGFNGFNGGDGGTYGLFNDPNLPNYISASKTFAAGTFAENVATIQSALAALVSKTKGKVNPKRDAIVIGLPPSVQIYLTTPTKEYGGITVEDWLSANFPRIRLVYAPQFEGANGGANVMYVFAESVDGQAVLHQNVQSSLYMLGFEKTSKSVVEDYSAATAGIMLRLPIGLVRVTAI